MTSPTFPYSRHRASYQRETRVAQRFPQTALYQRLHSSTRIDLLAITSAPGAIFHADGGTRTYSPRPNPLFGFPGGRRHVS